MKTILIIEDEKQLARFVELELKHEGFITTTIDDGRAGLEMALNNDFDCILLDIMLPGLNGIEVCRRLRQVKSTPIIMLTARDNVVDRVSGLDSGADDYIPKPFAIEELLARMRAIERRLQQVHEPLHLLSYRNLRVDMELREVKRGEEIIELTKREFDLLVTFIRNINRVMTREMLLDRVWGYDAFVETNVVDVYVRYLRQKLDVKGQESIIQTIRGTGYVMKNLN